tara:strand:- start:478 stop:804 length:327 start_codon:yes stop_codon:yes gene_type:complete
MARSQQSVFPKAVNFLGEKLNPERSLWRNVLIVALEDAVGRHWRNKSFGNPRGDYYRRSARDYFLEPNRDFALVCQYAGFDHEYIRMKAKQFFAERKKEDEKNNLHRV